MTEYFAYFTKAAFVVIVVFFLWFMGMFLYAMYDSVFVVHSHVIFGYNLTEHDIEEGVILAYCINTTVYLEECDTIYGSIDKPYGEPAK